MNSKLFKLTSMLPTGTNKLQYEHNMCKPIELQMEKSMINPKKFDMLAAHRLQDDLGNPLNEFLPVSNITYRESDSKWNTGHGMISLYNQNDNEIFLPHTTKKMIKPKLAICITMYSEPRIELESSLDGILNNMKHFKKDLNISNEEIVVVIIYDGIDRINCSKDSEDNMIDYFNLWDRTDGKQFNKQGKNSQFKDYTLENEYKNFKEKLERSQFNVEKMREEEFKYLKTNSSLKRKFDAYVKSFKGEDGVDKRSQEQQMTDFLYLEKSESQKFVSSKNNNSLLYQMRMKLQRIVDSEGRPDYETDSLASETNLTVEEQSYLHIFHCIKYKNGGKLSSHLWFFGGFCELFQPDHTILLDCGLIPGDRALLELYVSLETDPNIGGVCGFMGIALQQEEEIPEDKIDFLSKIYHQAFNIQRAQMFEYNMGHFIDKPFESFFGFIHVLPGAFSGYRWEALKRDSNGNSILDDYLASILDVHQELTLEQKNMNLAEDRILCLKIFSKQGKRYKLKYIRTADAKVDPVTTFPILVAQRRRWINGSYFALEESMKKNSVVFESEHTPLEFFFFKVSMKFGVFNQFLGSISQSIYFCIIFIMILTHVKDITLSEGGKNSALISVVLVTTFIVSYIMSVLALIYYSISFNNNNIQVVRLFYALSTYLGCITITSFVLMTLYIIQITIYIVKLFFLGQISEAEENRGLLNNWKDPFIRKIFGWVVLVGFGINLIPVLFYPSRIIEIIKSFHHFLGYSSQYIHHFLIYAICRIDDLSWGTKGANADDGSAQQEVSKMIKFKYVAKWLVLNVAIALVASILITSQLISDDPAASQARQYIIFIISLFFSGQQVFRVIFSTMYEIGFLFFRIKMRETRSRIKKLQSDSQEQIDLCRHLFLQKKK